MATFTVGSSQVGGADQLGSPIIAVTTTAAVAVGVALSAVMVRGAISTACVAATAASAAAAVKGAISSASVAVAAVGVGSSWQQPIVARLYSRSPAGTLLATLNNPRRRAWQERRNEPGAGSLEVHADDSQAALFTRGTVVRFSLFGAERFGFIVRPPRRHTITRDADAGKWLEVFGPGLLATLADAVVYPERGIGRRSPDRRWFDYSSSDFDDSAWVNATQVKQQSSTASPYGGGPADWPSAANAAWWICSRSVASPPLPTGRYYLRKSFTVAAETDAALFVSADDGFRVRLDGEDIGAETRAFLWGETRRIPLFIEAGTHQLAVEVENIARPAAPSTNISAFLASLHSVSAGGQTIGAAIVQTDSTWKTVDFPASPPTMTYTRVVRLLVEEAQARGLLTNLTLAFTDTADSGGATPTGVDLSFPVATTTLLHVIQKLAEDVCDVEIDHARLQLRLYNKGTAGAVRAVTLAKGVDLLELTHDPVDLAGNVAVTRDASGSWSETTHSASVSANGRVEVGVQLGTAASDGQAGRTLTEVLKDLAQVAYRAQFALDPVQGARPYVDWEVGDTITMPDTADANKSTRVDALTVAETEDGEPTFAGEGWQQ